MGTGRDSLGIRGARSGNHCTLGLNSAILSISHCTQKGALWEDHEHSVSCVAIALSWFL